MPKRLKQLQTKNKKALQLLAGLIYMVRVEGVEPPTAWFVAKYSIQLSYTRKLVFVLLTDPIKIESRISTFISQLYSIPLD